MLRYVRSRLCLIPHRTRIVGPATCPPSAAPAMAACVGARRITEVCGGFEDGVARAAASAAYAIVAEATEAELRGVTAATEQAR